MELNANPWIWKKDQLKVLNDESRYLSIVAERESGVSEALAYLVLMDLSSGEYLTFHHISTNQALGTDLLLKMIKWDNVIKQLYDKSILVYNQRTTTPTKLIIPNGSLVTTSRNSEDCVRGKTGTFIVENAGHIKNIDGLMQQMIPSAHNMNERRIIMTCNSEDEIPESFKDLNPTTIKMKALKR